MVAYWTFIVVSGSDSMTSLNKARASLLICILCFMYGFWLLVSKFHYLNDTNFLPQQTLELLVLDSNHFITWNVVVYLVYGVSLLYLTINLFFHVRQKEPELAIGILVMGGIWSGFMFLSGGLAIELINSVKGLHTLNSELAIEVWTIGSLLHESIGGGNELIGAIWVGLISSALPSRIGATLAAKLFGYAVTFFGLCTLFESSETFASLFGATLIFWFLLLHLALPTSFFIWKAK